VTRPASATVRTEWQNRVAAEYSVSLLAQDYAQRLTMFGAPPELIEQALNMALDELAHARHAAAVCDVADARGDIVFDPTSYAIESANEPAVHLVVVAMPNLCLGESLALRMVHRLRQNALVPEACAALDRVIADEPRHTALGWETLDWLLELPQADLVRESVVRELPRWLEILRGSFAGPHPQPHLTTVTEEDSAWGLAPVEDYRVVFDETVERDWKPRLARRGFALPN
jgi:hypothetical protein